MRTATCAFPFLSFVVLMTAGQVYASDRYGEAMARSYELERGEDPSGAAAGLEELTVDYPQDHALFLRLGWLRFSAGEYERAELHYESALAISPEALEARLGRGWCRYYLGDKQGSRQDFERVLELDSSSDSAREGMGLTEPVSSVGAILAAAYHFFDGHPTKTDGLGFAVTMPAVLADNYLLGARYRRTAFTLAAGNGRQSYWQDSLDFVQNEGYLYGGVAYALWGATVQYGYLDNDSADDQQGHLAGGTVRFSPWGDIFCSVNGGFYDVQTVVRSAVSWRIPVASWLAIRPGGAYQRAAGEHLASGSLALEGLVSALRYSLRGRYGKEKWPAYLDELTVYNLPDDLLYGAEATLAADVGRGFSLGAAYEYRRLSLAKSESTAESDFHLWALFVHWQPAGGK